MKFSHFTSRFISYHSLSLSVAHTLSLRSAITIALSNIVCVRMHLRQNEFSASVLLCCRMPKNERRLVSCGSQFNRTLRAAENIKYENGFVHSYRDMTQNRCNRAAANGILLFHAILCIFTIFTEAQSMFTDSTENCISYALRPYLRCFAFIRCRRFWSAVVLFIHRKWNL